MLQVENRVHVCIYSTFIMKLYRMHSVHKPDYICKHYLTYMLNTYPKHVSCISYLKAQWRIHFKSALYMASQIHEKYIIDLPTHAKL